MSHIMIIFKSMLAIAVIFSVVFAAPNPDSSEQSTVTDEPGSSIIEDNDYVSPTTSIGDFDEDASLADSNDSDVASADDNGLRSGYDSESIIKVSELPSTGMLTKKAIVVFQIFDKIIEIPINVLRYINVYLNQKLMYRGQPAGEAVSSDGPAGSSWNGTAGASVMVPTQSNYDAIFNIPITAMRSVQNLFNWVVEKLCKNRGICNSGAH
ncbi:unnamed protein product [Macrosiphum euphorbiae]|uniref:Uncharacterized protein n=1 Tax=Macrosiphum euphorbiae TaxID=13131 RepID=A0AAV0XPX6_9HEMI|nr:unnamed protein product [Macrosiphum euphorbiae]